MRNQSTNGALLFPARNCGVKKADYVRKRCSRRSVHLVPVGLHPLGLRYLRGLLSRDPNIAFVQEFEISHQSIAQTIVFIVDEAGFSHSLEARIVAIHHQFPSAKILLLHESLTREKACRLLALGVHAFVNPNGLQRVQFLTVLRKLEEGRIHVKRDLLEHLAANISLYGSEKQTQALRFTNREQAILELLKQRLSNKEIAVDLGISVRTVGFHVGNILEKLGVHDRYSAVDIAKRLDGLLGDKLASVGEMRTATIPAFRRIA